jgi:hypothetical protein
VSFTLRHHRSRRFLAIQKLHFLKFARRRVLMLCGPEIPVSHAAVLAFVLDNLKRLGTFKAMSDPRLSLYEPAMVFRA